VKSKSVKKSSKRKVWKPTGKVFINIGYIWRPTGETFTIVGNACPLNRITTTTEVPLRKPNALENETPKPVVTLVYSRKPRKSKTNVLVSKSKVVQIVLWYLDSNCSKHMTGDRSQLTNFVNKFLGTVKFGNDHVAKILGYGNYQIGNVMISRVYYVEGLGHNLFSVGSKDETLDFIIKFLKMIQVRLKVPVRRIKKDNGTEFVNQTLREYYEKVGISHETSVARSPQQNSVVERRNHTLIEAARTMLIYAKALLFLWAEAVATAFTPKDDIGNLLVMHPLKKHFEFTTEYRGIIERQFHVDLMMLMRWLLNNSSSERALLEYSCNYQFGTRANPPPFNHCFVTTSRSDWRYIVSTSCCDELLTPPPSVDLLALKSLLQLMKYMQIMGNDPYFGIPISRSSSDQSSSTDSYHTITQFHHKATIHEQALFCSTMLSSAAVELIHIRCFGLTLARSKQSKKRLNEFKRLMEKSKLDEDKEGKAVDPSHYHG
ncbi:integrase, catalytic region, zinc finger, CCHC-type containing protein, partial [Tanacetum coccineum]